MPVPNNDIVIIGGGIIGVTSAYYLSMHPRRDRTQRIIILEASSIAAGASGKAGGLLATWAFPSSIASLSFQLHAELADKFGGKEKWGYRVLDDCWEVTGHIDLNNNSTTKLKMNTPSDLHWLDGIEKLNPSRMLDANDQTAQVHPKLFTEAIFKEAQSNGVEIIYGKAVYFDHDYSQVTGVTYIPKGSDAPEFISAKTVIISAGPWTSSLLPTTKKGNDIIEGQRAHSIIIQTSESIPAQAVFSELSVHELRANTTKQSNQIIRPEFYPRPDSTIYVSGSTDDSPLPELASEVSTDQTYLDTLINHVQHLSSALKNGKIITQQACYLPNVTTKRQGPIIGGSQKFKGLFIAAGHTCWGIQNSAATGFLIAENVWTDEKRKEIVDLNPSHWDL